MSSSSAPRRRATIDLLDCVAVLHRVADYLRGLLLREVVRSAVPLTPDHAPGTELEAGVRDPDGALQDRTPCCGTMNLSEYHDIERLLERELSALARWGSDNGRPGTQGALQEDDSAPALPQPGPAPEAQPESGAHR